MCVWACVISCPPAQTSDLSSSWEKTVITLPVESVYSLHVLFSPFLFSLNHLWCTVSIVRRWSCEKVKADIYKLIRIRQRRCIWALSGRSKLIKLSASQTLNEWRFPSVLPSLSLSQSPPGEHVEVMSSIKSHEAAVEAADLFVVPPIMLSPQASRRPS